MSTQCRFCGAAIRPNTMFCPSCGQLVVADVPAPSGSALPPPFRTTGGGPSSPSTPAAAPVAPPPAVEPVPLPDTAAWTPAAPSAPAAPVVPPPAPVAPAGLALRLPDGTEIPLDRTLVLGRNPAGRADAHGGVPVAIPDPGRSVSRVHLIIAPAEPGRAHATDAGSGNGTTLERGGARHPLAAQTPVEIHAGDRLLLGDVLVVVGTAR
jgi:hypothetical protein